MLAKQISKNCLPGTWQNTYVCMPMFFFMEKKKAHKDLTIKKKRHAFQYPTFSARKLVNKINSIRMTNKAEKICCLNKIWKCTCGQQKPPRLLKSPMPHSTVFCFDLVFLNKRRTLQQKINWMVLRHLGLAFLIENKLRVHTEFNYQNSRVFKDLLPCQNIFKYKIQCYDLSVLW